MTHYFFHNLKHQKYRFPLKRSLERGTKKAMKKGLKFSPPLSIPPLSECSVLDQNFLFNLESIAIQVSGQVTLLRNIFPDFAGFFVFFSVFWKNYNTMSMKTKLRCFFRQQISQHNTMQIEEISQLFLIYFDVSIAISRSHIRNIYGNYQLFHILSPKVYCCVVCRSFQLVRKKIIDLNVKKNPQQWQQY